MTNQNLAATNKIYQMTGSAWVKSVNVHHTKFAKFSLLIREFEKSLGKNIEDEYWGPIISALKRFRFRCCSLPLPFSNTLLGGSELLSSLSSKAEIAETAFPGAAKYLESLHSRAEELISSGANPLWDAFILNKENDKSLDGLVVLETKFIMPTHEYFKSKDLHINVVNQTSAKQFEPISEMAVFGASRWYDDHLFRAPRAKIIYLVSYSFLRDNLKLDSLFLNPIDYSPIKIVADNSNDEGVEGTTFIAAEDLFRPIDWKATEQKAREYVLSLSDNDDFTPAKLFILDTGNGIYLHAEVDTNVHVISTGFDGDRKLIDVAVTSIKPGMAVISRGEQGGDYIKEEADNILDQKGLKLEARSAQLRWKRALNRQIQESGTEQKAIGLLHESGCKKANAGNLRNWISPNSIRTKSKDDFKALMTFSGLEDEWESIWDLMGEIDSSHRSAGFQIRKKLMIEVKNSGIV